MGQGFGKCSYREGQRGTAGEMKGDSIVTVPVKTMEEDL